LRFLYSKQFKYFIGALFIALVLICVHAFGWMSGIESGVADVPRPFVYVFESIGHGTRSFFGIFSSVSKLESQNAQLNAENTNLQEQLVSLQSDKLENELLRQELNYRSTTQLSVISASVIGKDPTGLSQTVTIDQGSKDGIQVGDAVVAQGVLIGKITNLTDYNAQVLLITDPQSSVDAEISVTGDTGVLNGSYGSGLTITMISQTSSITNGDLVVSAGLTAQVPKGILIGTIGDIQTGKNELLQNASVVSPVDFKNLQFFAVVKP
jgi:rod shape-determining protein MreC